MARDAAEAWKGGDTASGICDLASTSRNSSLDVRARPFPDRAALGPETLQGARLQIDSELCQEGVILELAKIVVGEWESRVMVRSRRSGAAVTIAWLRGYGYSLTSV